MRLLIFMKVMHHVSRVISLCMTVQNVMLTNQ